MHNQASRDFQRIPVFVTGNANKLREVKAILSDGGNPIEIESKSLDGKLQILTYFSLYPVIELSSLQSQRSKVLRKKSL